MKNKEKIDAIKLTRTIRDQLYKCYQASPEMYYNRLNEQFLNLQKEFSRRTDA